VNLEKPRFKGEMSVEEALYRRRSVRDYSPEPLSISEISQILWSAQGLTHPYGYRTAPSAGALYPLEIYIHATRVENLPKGIYKYMPSKHSLLLIKEGDFSKELFKASLSQEQVLTAALIILIFGVFARTTSKYGKRGIRYVFNEVGHVSQNIYLQATALRLGTVAIGAFYDEEIKSIVRAEKEEEPLYIMPIGKPI